MELVVGSNILAWLLVIGLKKFNPEKNVTLINFSTRFGGNSQSFQFRDVNLDFGMQTYFDSGVNWADEIMREALLSAGAEYNEFLWPDHDPCITIQSGSVVNTVFPIHRSNWTIAKYEKTFSALDRNKSNGDGLRETLISKFGGHIWEDVFASIVKKFLTIPLKDASMVSLSALPLSRISIPHISDHSLLSSEHLMDRLAIRDAENLPLKFKKKRATIYPKEGGVGKIIHALKLLAEKYGVDIRIERSIHAISYLNGQLTYDNCIPNKVYWTLQNKLLKSFLKDDVEKFTPMPFRGSLVAVFCDKGFNISKAHYLLSFDDDPIFRITFYGNLAGAYSRSYATIEFLTPPEDFDPRFTTYFLKRSALINENSTCFFSAPQGSPWPVSYKIGYTEHRLHEECLIEEQIKNLLLMNANPAHGSIMQTPTMSSRLERINFS